MDDHLPLWDALSEVLGEYGICVVGMARRGDLAVQAVAQVGGQQAVDVVVMDVRLPGVDGLEATEQVKRAHPGVAVLLHSASYGGWLQHEAVAVGAFGAVAKGAAPACLVGAIFAAAKDARARQSAQHGLSLEAAGGV